MKNEITAQLKSEIERIDYRNRVLGEEKNRLTERIKEIEKEVMSLVQKRDRALHFPTDFRGCPICFIENGSTVEFTPVPSDNDLDKFKCTHCGYLLEVEV